MIQKIDNKKNAQALQPQDLRPLCDPSLWQGHEKIALAVSGGPDSMALCRLFSRFVADNGGPELHILTVDHGLRPEAAAEARQVGAWIAGWPHIRHEILTCPPAAIGRTRVMEEARQARYRLMADYCRSENITVLMTAHHQDDQAETFLFRLAKGSGLDGLGAMPQCQVYSDHLQIIRPFLEISKTQLVATCAAENVPFVEDPSNENADFARPRLRRVQAALAAEGLSTKRLSVTAARMRRARQALDYYAQKAFDMAHDGGDSGRAVFKFDILAAQPEETRLRVLTRAMEMIYENGPDDFGYGPRRKKLEALANRIFTEPGYKSATLYGLIFMLDRKENKLTICPAPAPRS